MTSQIYKSPLWLRYGLPFFSVAVTIGVRMAMIDWFEGRYPLILFVIPVIVSTWYGGVLPGFIAVVSSIVAGIFLLQPYNLQLDAHLGIERLFVFSIVTTLCIFSITRLNKARHQAEINELKLHQEIHERAKIEDALRQEAAIRSRTEAALAEALAKTETASHAKTEFLANMSHEIRTPMNAVIGLTSILSMSQPLTVKQKELVSTLKISADSLLDLINDMLDIAKIEANLVVLEYIPFNLRYAAEEVMNIMSLKAAEKKLRFTMDDSGLHHRDFIGDPTRIKQIFMNLCSNAIKFTPTGEVSIILKSSAQLSGIDDVTIIIKDTGIGIAKDKMESIFGKFVQGDATINRRYGGTGLGLTITKNLTEIMGGSIAVDSQIEKGTTFTVTLPLKRSIASSMQPPNSRQDNIAKASHGTMKALLVEDNQANILVATSFLEHFGFKYDVALNGIDAVKKWESGSYFIILMDIQMPGQNGFEATRSIREHEKRLGKKRTPIIGMTAHVLAGDRDLCIECGMDDYISKPIDPEHLETKIRNIYNDASGAFSSNRSSSKANQAH